MCEFWVAATIVAFISGAFFWNAVLIAMSDRTSQKRYKRLMEDQ